MAGEILLSNIGDLTTSEAATAEFLMLIADARSLPEHPAITKWKTINDLQSNVVKIPHVGLGGYDTAQATGTENAQIPNTALADASSLVTVVRYGHARSVSDLARIVRGNLINPQALAADSIKVFANRMTQLICDAIDGFTLTGGTSGVNLDAADVLAALGTAEVGNLRGPFLGALHGQQWSDLIQDLGLGIGGALQFVAATQELMVLRGDSFKGSMLGVDWCVSNRVNSNGTDRLGAIFGPGGVVYCDGIPIVEDSSQQMLVGGRVLFERDRNARASETGYVSSAYMGVSIGIQNGLTLGSDA